MVGQLMMRKIFGTFLLIGLFLIASIFFVACSKDNNSHDDGVVYGVVFTTGIEDWKIDSQAVDAGGKVSEPVEFLREGYILKGWMCGDKLWDFDEDVVNEHIELVAVWEENTASWEYTNGLSFALDETSAFYEVTGFSGTSKSVKIPLYYNGDGGIKKVESIRAEAFKNSLITSITLPDSIKHIGSKCFVGSRITSLVIPSSLTYVSDFAFYGMSNLNNIQFLNKTSDIVIGEYAFASCLNLTSVIMPDNVVEFKTGVFQGSNIQSLIFGSKSKLLVVGERSLSELKLSSLILPNSVKTIKTNALSSCKNLEKVVVPANVNSLGENVFSGCDKLKAVFFSGEVPTVANKNWTGLENTLEFGFSSNNLIEAGRWEYSTDGLPRLKKQEKTVSVDARSLIDIVDSYSQVKLVIRQTYNTGKGAREYEPLAYTINADGFAEIKVDLLACSGYRLEVVYAGVTDYSSLANKLVAVSGVDETKNSLTLTEPDILSGSVKIIYGD